MVAALLLALLSELTGQALVQEGPLGTEGALVAGGGSPGLFWAAALLYPLGTLCALLSQGRWAALPDPHPYPGALGQAVGDMVGLCLF